MGGGTEQRERVRERERDAWAGLHLGLFSCTA